jgi:hypothetical protein
VNYGESLRLCVIMTKIYLEDLGVGARPGLYVPNTFDSVERCGKMTAIFLRADSPGPQVPSSCAFHQAINATRLHYDWENVHQCRKKTCDSASSKPRTELYHFTGTVAATCMTH